MNDDTNISIEKYPLKGVFICLLAYFLFSVMGLCEKSISQSVNLPVILFFQNFICLILIIPRVKKSWFVSIEKRHHSAYVLRILSGIGCYATLFYIIRFIPISEALIYQYGGSIWTPIIGLLWLKIRMPKNVWYSIIIGLIGIILILKPNSSIFGIVSIVGILCGLFQAFSMVSIRKLSVYEPISRVLFYNFFVATVITTPFVFTHLPTLSNKNLILLCLIGITTYLAQLCLATSLKYASATTLSPICYSSILFSGIFASFFWHEIITKITLLGMLLVVIGCILSLVISHKNAQLNISNNMINGR